MISGRGGNNRKTSDMSLRWIKRRILRSLGVLQKPLVLQMPITSRCNSQCKTCNIWKSHSNTDIDHEALRRALKDDFFSEVRTVGLNGGEFTLVPTFLDIVDAVLSLPKISSVHLITNGLLPERLFKYLVSAKGRCEKRGVSLNVCLSVDGVNEVHERTRGIPHCFKRTKEILDELYKNHSTYCDGFSVGCTLSRHNIAFVKETDSFLQSFKGLRVEYHLAIPNKRIHTDADYQQYYVMSDSRSRLLAAEFFYEKFISAKDENQRRQCFANYFFLMNKGKGRLCRCEYLERDVTIDENLNLAFCATASNAIGNLKTQSATSIIRSSRAKHERRRIQSNECPTCIHYSYHPLTLKGKWLYLNEKLRNQCVFHYFDARAQARWTLRTKRTLGVYAHVAKQVLQHLSRMI